MASMPDFNALLLGGYQAGREMKRQEGAGNALTGVINGDPNALGELARYDPKTAMAVKEHQDDRTAKLQEQRTKLLGEGQKLVGQAALVVAQHPEAERPAAWDAQIDGLVQQGWTGMAQYKGKYTREALESAIAQGGQASEYGQQTKPTYMAIPEGGTLVNTRDPSAVSQFGVPPQAQRPHPTAPKIIPQRPPNMDDAALIAQAHDAVRKGANVEDVFRQLQAWGVNP